MRWRHVGGLPPAYCLPGQAPSAGIGGQAILTLRALMQSGRFDSAWEMLSGTDRRSDDSRQRGAVPLHQTYAPGGAGTKRRLRTWERRVPLHWGQWRGTGHGTNRNPEKDGKSVQDTGDLSEGADAPGEHGAGRGTTLEMLWKHRDSTDIDLFVSNRTLMEISQAGRRPKRERKREFSGWERLPRRKDREVESSRGKSRVSRFRSAPAITSHGTVSRPQASVEQGCSADAHRRFWKERYWGAGATRQKRSVEEERNGDGCRHATFTTSPWREGSSGTARRHYRKIGNGDTRKGRGVA